MVTRLPGEPERLFIVCNAAMKAQDFALMRAKLFRPDARHSRRQGLVAVQGPKAVEVVEGPDPRRSKISSSCRVAGFEWRDPPVFVTRSGYTGEDGYEISLPALAGGKASRAAAVASRLPADRLGARAIAAAGGRFCASTATTSTRRPIRSRRRSPGRSASGDARTAVFRARASRSRWKDGAGAPAHRPRARRQQPAREGAEIAPDGKVVGKDHIRRAGAQPSAQAGRDGLRGARIFRAGTELAALVRGKALPATRHEDAVRSEQLFRAERGGSSDGCDPLHQADHEYILVDGDIGTLSAFPTMRNRSSATSSSSNFPMSARS